MDRRTFLLASAASQTRILGANDRIRAGIIGSGGRGRFLTEQFKELGVEMNGVCDIYTPNLQQGLKVASTGARSFDDYRRLLDDKSFDAVVIATPDHWHARMIIDAVNAGKDVYVEKPMAHEIQEGFAVIDAVRKAKRIVQVGTQRRSAEIFLEAKKIMDSGQPGEIRLVTSQWFNYQGSLNHRKLEGDLDWKQWLGSANQVPMDAQRFFNWYYYWDYSGGLLVGQAAHIFDTIQWYMNSTYPIAVTCTGGQVNLPGAEIPETASVSIEFPENYLATFTIGYKAMKYQFSNDQLMQYHGNKARFDVGREGYSLYPQSNDIEMVPSIQKKKLGSFNLATLSHIRNFMECIRDRKEPNAPVEAGQATNVLLCMSLDSMRAGRRMKWNAQKRVAEF